MRFKLIKYCSAVVIFVFLTASAPQTLGASFRHKNGELIQPPNSGTVYAIKNNQLFAFKNLIEFYTWGYDLEQILPATQEDMDLPFNGIIRARPYTLAKDSDGTLGLILDDGVIKIPDLNTLLLSGLATSGMFNINLSDYPIRGTMESIFAFGPTPPGAVFNLNGTIYLVASGGRAGFPSDSVFKSYRFLPYSIKLANYFDEKLTDLPPLRYRDGTLVRDRNNKTVCVVSGDFKYCFPTMQSLLSKKYAIKEIIDGDLGGYTEGETIN